METKVESQAKEVANVIDYHQGLLRDLQGKIAAALGPIRDSGKHDEFVKELESFKKKVDEKLNRDFEEKPDSLHKDGDVAKKAAQILDSRPLDKDDVKENVLSDEQKDAVAKAQAGMVEAQPQPGQKIEEKKPATGGPVATNQEVKK